MASRPSLTSCTAGTPSAKETLIRPASVSPPKPSKVTDWIPSCVREKRTPPQMPQKPMDRLCEHPRVGYMSLAKDPACAGCTSGSVVVTASLSAQASSRQGYRPQSGVSAEKPSLKPTRTFRVPVKEATPAGSVLVEVNLPADPSQKSFTASPGCQNTFVSSWMTVRVSGYPSAAAVRTSSRSSRPSGASGVGTGVSLAQAATSTAAIKGISKRSISS